MAKLFSNREIRTVVIFLPLVLLFIVGMVLVRPKKESAKKVLPVETELERRAAADSIELRPFDPNTVEYEKLLGFGLSKYEAASLVRFRASGKVFRIPEDVAICYGISDSLYGVLKPYIRIGRKYAYAPRGYRSERIGAVKLPVSLFRIDTVSAAYLCAIGAFSKKQAAVVINYRNSSGFRNIEEFRTCYVVDDSVATALEPYIIFPEPKRDLLTQPLEINTADSTALRGVVGIGEKTVVAIMRYRERLGGFRNLEQLAEVQGVLERNYERIVKQIYCDSCKIQKIDVNFASPNALGRHPYIPPQSLRKILKARQLKGGWSTAEEFLNEHILTQDEAARLLPYVQFDKNSGTGDE